MKKKRKSTFLFSTEKCKIEIPCFIFLFHWLAKKKLEKKGGKHVFVFSPHNKIIKKSVFFFLRSDFEETKKTKIVGFFFAQYVKKMFFLVIYCWENKSQNWHFSSCPQINHEIFMFLGKYVWPSYKKTSFFQKRWEKIIFTFP